MPSDEFNDLLEAIDDGHEYKYISGLDWKELEQLIQEARYAYIHTDEPLIDDKLYDTLIKKLKIVRPSSKQLKVSGEEPKSSNDKVQLPYYMSGITDKQTGNSDQEEEAKFLKRYLSKYPGPYVISDKEDGISCLVIVKLVTVKPNKKVAKKDIEITFYTKGSGDMGRNVSYLQDYVNHRINKETFVKLFDELDFGDVPMSKREIVMRGELIMKEATFKKYYSKTSKYYTDDKKYSSARSAVNGVTLRRADNMDKKRAERTDLIFYQLIKPSGYTVSQQLNLLTEWNLAVVPFEIVDASKLHNDQQKKILKKRRLASEYYIDGIVNADDSEPYETTDENPKYMYAFKGVGEIFTTTVKKVQWSASKDGLLKPVAIYETIETPDADLNRATLYNARYVVDSQISQGAKIIVVRSGDTIPNPLGTVVPGKKPYVPSQNNDKGEFGAILDDEDDYTSESEEEDESSEEDSEEEEPVKKSKSKKGKGAKSKQEKVGSKTKTDKNKLLKKNDWSWKWNDAKVEIVLKHPEKNKDVTVQRLVYFCEKIGAKNWAQGILTNLVYNQNINTVADLIRLSINDLVEMKGFKLTLAIKLIDYLHSALKKLTMVKLMVGSCCFGGGFGTRKISKILNKYPGIVKAYHSNESDSSDSDKENESNYETWYNKIINIYGFQEKTTTKFLEALPKFQTFLYDECLPALKAQKIKIKGINSNKMNEEELQKKREEDAIPIVQEFENKSVVLTHTRDPDVITCVTKSGGNVTTSVSSRTYLLVYGLNKTSGNMKKADAKHIPKMSVEEFKEKYFR